MSSTPVLKRQLIFATLTNLREQQRRELFAQLSGLGLEIQDRRELQQTAGEGVASAALESGSEAGSSTSTLAQPPSPKAGAEEEGRAAGPSGAKAAGSSAPAPDGASASPERKVPPKEWFCRIFASHRGQEVLEVNLRAIRQTVAQRAGPTLKADPNNQAAKEALELLSQLEQLIERSIPVYSGPNAPPSYSDSCVVNPLKTIRARVLDKSSGQGPSEEPSVPVPEPDEEDLRTVTTGSVPTHCSEYFVRLDGEPAEKPQAPADWKEVRRHYSDLYPETDSDDEEESEPLLEARLVTKSGKEVDYEEQFHTILTVPEKYSPSTQQALREVALNSVYVVDGGGLGGIAFSVEDEPPAIIKNHQLPTFVELEIVLDNGEVIEERLLLDYVAERTVEVIPVRGRLLLVSVEDRQRLGLPPPIIYRPKEVYFLELAKALGDPEQTQDLYCTIREQGRRVPFSPPELSRRVIARRVRRALKDL